MLTDHSCHIGYTTVTQLQRVGVEHFQRLRVPWKMLAYQSPESPTDVR